MLNTGKRKNKRIRSTLQDVYNQEMSRSHGELQTSLWEKQHVPMDRDPREYGYKGEVGSLTARVFLLLLQPVTMLSSALRTKNL